MKSGPGNGEGFALIEQEDPAARDRRGTSLDDLELELKRKLIALQNRYQDDAKPIIDQLVRISALRIPRTVIPLDFVTRKLSEDRS